MIDQGQADEMLKQQGVGDYLVRLVGVRGFDESMGQHGNDMGIYDDAVFRRIGDQFDLFRASTDPGRFYIEHPLTAKGCARLRSGLWWFVLGDHKGHPALIQEGDFDVDRLDEFGTPDMHERGQFGINLHSGGSEEDVGRFSAGCQIIHCPEGAWGATWDRFFNPIAKAMKEHHQSQAPYLLIEG